MKSDIEREGGKKPRERASDRERKTDRQTDRQTEREKERERTGGAGASGGGGERERCARESENLGANDGPSQT
jgi:hypothetical protein